MSLLSINGLTQRFGGLQAVSDFNIELEEGSLTSLIGPNGAGKTTIFNLISGFYQPTEGVITFNGTPTSKMKPHQVTSLGVARTFQNIRLWHDMTVMDNIRIAQHYRMGYGVFDAIMRTKNYYLREKEIERISTELLEFMDLREYAEELPTNLPYGLQRRVEIARAMSIQPSLLLLDEPAAGLNSSDVDGLITLIKWIHNEFDITILMIEHQMKVVMSLCSWIKCIDFGTTIDEGTPEHIQSSSTVIKAYLGDDSI
ncbi:amino acid/amide ABC transporter ATP-binding protein 1, HAAT family (TC 3.A.1.4.-) [Maridesulfovibrio ferrireducens]|uniref:Amino acid/amide ABC transporter ATP-binding protein 1, HAAT family (TC 3.A.1.4.-) n=1 Tax=Maridesulfovibrio ferrireducens TaxID=246191 RepID=A0A1G9FM19_9BACT|nr:ABC transporter ATP-binding protein [Maridesulfovibrio ferrireducens]SDK89419.1 amino acid/amide ABC transporter ATP-binding protein 1, HAAT family (TC 3.A.1.4.-) [Maridesulfovibrio ferrireducens]